MRRQPGLRALLVLFAAATAVMVADAAPAPGGHDLVLRGLIEDAARGQIQYQTLTPELRDAMRPQAAVAQSELSALGVLKAVTFESLGPSGTEFYRTAFERGALEWAFSVNAAGLIDNARYRRPVAGPS